MKERSKRQPFEHGMLLISKLGADNDVLVHVTEELHTPLLQEGKN